MPKGDGMKKFTFGIMMLGLLLTMGTPGLITPAQAGELTQAGIELQYRACVKRCAGDVDCICDCEEDKQNAFRNIELEPCREAYRNCKENCYQNNRGDESCNKGCQEAYKKCIGK